VTIWKLTVSGWIQKPLAIPHFKREGGCNTEREIVVWLNTDVLLAFTFDLFIHSTLSLIQWKLGWEFGLINNDLRETDEKGTNGDWKCPINFIRKRETKQKKNARQIRLAQNICLLAIQPSQRGTLQLASTQGELQVNMVNAHL